MGGPDARDILGAVWTLIAVSSVFVCARFYVRFPNRHKYLIISDLFLGLALLNIVLSGVIATLLVHYDGFNSSREPTNMAVFKMYFALATVFDLGLYWPKFSIVAFYYHFIRPSSRKLRLALYALTVYVAVTALATCLADTFWCGLPISRNWNGRCNRITARGLLALDWFCHLSSDIFILLLPFPLILKMNLRSRREKIALYTMFGLGIVTIALASARLGIIVGTRRIGELYIWGVGELATSLVVVSLPALRPLLPTVPTINIPNRGRHRHRHRKRGSGTSAMVQGDSSTFPASPFDSMQKPSQMTQTNNLSELGVIPDCDDDEDDGDQAGRDLWAEHDVDRVQPAASIV